MRRPLQDLSFMVILLVLPIPLYAQEDERPPDPRSEEMRLEGERSQRASEASRRAYLDHQRQIQELQKSFRSSLDPRFSNTDRELTRRLNARDDLMELARDLQQLYDLSREPSIAGTSRKEIANLSKDSEKFLGKLLDFINRGAEPPPTDDVLIPNEPFQNRMVRLVELFRRQIAPMDTFIIGDLLDVKTLEQARSDFELMDALIRALPESNFF